MREELSIYIHIPFCVRKCLYCDFLSFPVGEVKGNTALQKAAISRSGMAVHKAVDEAVVSGRMVRQSAACSMEKMESYVNLLCREIIRSARIYHKYQVISVFLGGGTPSLLPADQISRIMGAVRTHYRMAENAEITMEINPGTIEEGEPEQYIASGINRISIGLQSADDDALRRIGRIHDYRAFLKTYDLVRRAGFCNVNIDIMASLPGQSVVSCEQTLREVTALAPEHISAYSLILEEGTPLYERQSEYRFPTEEESAEMDLLIRRHLAAGGYHRYEISNYARDGYECRHNKVYWQRGNYVGFGLGAASMVENVRWSNPAAMEAYEEYVVKQEPVAEGTPAVEYECSSTDCRRSAEQAEQAEQVGAGGGHALYRQCLTRQEQMEEYMFLGLRMICGVNTAEFGRIFGNSIEDVYGDVIGRLCRQGLLVREEDGVRLTQRGLDVSNYAMAQFLLD